MSYKIDIAKNNLYNEKAVNYKIVIIIIEDNFIKKLLKSYLQLIRFKKRKNYSFKNTIYNICRFKKHLI